MTTTVNDPVETIPDPETLKRMLAASCRRSDLLRSLLRVARRKAAYDQPATATPTAAATTGGR